MVSPFTLEIATFTWQGALDAFQSGAHRIELCENPKDGGTTPSYGMLKKVREQIPIPIFPIIRPRGGHFVYSDAEFEIMQMDVVLCKQLGFEGVVVGLLTPQGEIDVYRTKALVELAHPMQVTFHRAFDRVALQTTALEAVIETGCTRILTSGQYPQAMDGISNLQSLVQQANGRITIMPGSGVNSDNLQTIYQQTGATEFHAGARMILQDEHITSPASMQEQMNHIGVNAVEVKAMLSILTNLANNHESRA